VEKSPILRVRDRILSEKWSYYYKDEYHPERPPFVLMFLYRVNVALTKKKKRKCYNRFI